jgi:hypothetical protein
MRARNYSMRHMLQRISDVLGGWSATLPLPVRGGLPVIRRDRREPQSTSAFTRKLAENGRTLLLPRGTWIPKSKSRRPTGVDLHQYKVNRLPCLT